MHRRALAALTAMTCSAILLTGLEVRLATAADGGGAKGKAAATATDLFGLTKVLGLHIEISADEFRAMQPPAPAAFGGPPPAPRPKKPGERESERNLFGVEFPWVRGSVTAEGKTYRTVGFRYSGNASYMASAGGLKRSLLIDVDRVDHHAFHGLRAIHLQGGALDPTKAREALAFALFRAAGVPAPRTALAEVTLTVPGRYDKAYLGLYTLVEPVDRAFSIDRFHTDQGLLPHIIPLTSRPQSSPMPATRPVNAQPDPDRALPHLALRALVALRAVDACLEAIDGPHREGALRALRFLHEPRAVEGLIKKLNAARSPEVRREILATLVRLYHREADYQGSWWGIRPDTTGPYYDPREWECSQRIASVLRSAVLDGDASTIAFVRAELARHRVSLDGLPGDPGGSPPPPAEAEVRVVIAKADPKNPDQIGNMSYESAAKRALQTKGNAERGLALFTSQSCRACHTVADGQTPKGPHLVDIGKRYSPAELVESILKPGAKIAQGYEAYTFAMVDGRVFSGFIVSESVAVIQIRESSGVLRELKRADIEERRRQESSAMPEGIAATLTPEQLADLVAYLQSLDPKREIRPDR